MLKVEVAPLLPLKFGELQSLQLAQSSPTSRMPRPREFLELLELRECSCGKHYEKRIRRAARRSIRRIR